MRSAGSFIAGVLTLRRRSEPPRQWRRSYWVLGAFCIWCRRLPRRRPSEGPLWLVTRGAQVVTICRRSDRLQPGAAGLWGLASVIAIEQPSFSPRVIDLDPAVGNDGAIALFSELSDKSRRSDRTAWRGAVDRLDLQNYRHRANARAGSHKCYATPGDGGAAGHFDGVELRY